jgi:hypothetical protein
VVVPVFKPGIHSATLDRQAASSINYAISIPPGYDRRTPVPLVLALHFGVQTNTSRDAGRDLRRRSS